MHGYESDHIQPDKNPMSQAYAMNRSDFTRDINILDQDIAELTRLTLQLEESKNLEDLDQFQKVINHLGFKETNNNQF